MIIIVLALEISDDHFYQLVYLMLKLSLGAVFDLDRDTVRCRWASSDESECGGVCNKFPVETLSLNEVYAGETKSIITGLACHFKSHISSLFYALIIC